MTIKLKKISTAIKKGKKFTAEFEIRDDKNNKTIKKVSFGYDNPEDKLNDYTRHKDINRRNRYIIRHEKDLTTNDPTRAGYLSLFLLWNKPTLEASVRDYNKRLKVYNDTGKFPTKDLIDEAKEMMEEARKEKEKKEKKEKKD